jgi:addiction module HigA family antidote
MERIRTHPGTILLEEFMKPLGLSANALAEELHVPANRILAITKGERAVTADTALRLSRYFGTTAEVWVNLQAAHDLSLAKARQGKDIAKEVNPRAA